MKRFCLPIAVAALLTPFTAPAADRVALVIGEAQYKYTTALPQAAADTDLIASVLEQLGFETTAVVDPTRAGLADALSGFAARSDGAEIAILYFSGYGLATGSDNFLLPVDARPSGDVSVRLDGINLEDAIASMARAGTKVALVNTASENPFLMATRLGTTSVNADNVFAPVETTAGSVFVSQAQTLHADADEPSAYATGFISAAAQPGADLASALNAFINGMGDKDTAKPVHFGSIAAGPPLLPQQAAAPEPQVTTAQPPADETPAQTCDRLAGDPNDPQKAANYTGSESESNIPRSAEEACTAALGAHPDDPRLLYQAGRAARDEAVKRQYFERAAKGGSVQASVALANQILGGRAGFSKDEAAAARMLDEAIAKGSTSAMVARGRLHLSASAPSQNTAEALRLLHSASEKGNAVAAVTLGNMYRDGNGVPKSRADAMAWYKRAMNRGTGAGLDQLGDLYRTGAPAERNYAVALAMYLKAAAFGESESRNAEIAEMYDLGLGVPKYPAEAEKWYLKAGPEGEFQIGVRREFWPGNERTWLGKYGFYGDTPPDRLADAISWYTRAADHGFALAQWRLGFIYKIGHGVEEDRRRALEWYGKAADQGHVPSMLRIAEMHDLDGNTDQARDWYEKAAATGDTESMLELGKLARNASPIALAEAEKWFRAAADLGNAEAMRRLGRLYERDMGDKPNLAEAMKWYRKAGELGDAIALNNIGAMYANGKSVAKDSAEAGKWYEKAAAAGNHYANLNLAILFSRGLGTRKDIPLSVQLAELAVRKDEQAREDLKENWSDWVPEFLSAFQKRLKGLGKYEGAIDGRFGSGTLAAIDSLAED